MADFEQQWPNFEQFRAKYKLRIQQQQREQQ
jgi:hypothetical protein